MAHSTLSPKFLQLLPAAPGDTLYRSSQFANFPVSFFPRLWDRVNVLHLVKLQNKMGFLKDNFITMATLMGVIAGKNEYILKNMSLLLHDIP